MALAIVDADTIYFRAVKTTLKRKDIRDIINSTMQDIMGACFATEADLMVAIKGHGNFRKDLYPDYKKNRPELLPKEKEALNYAHNYMKEKWKGVEATGMEADDLVCIWAYEARENEDQFVICGIDKDLKQIPGNHYNYNKKEHEFVDDQSAYHNLMVQCLTGDTSDNIPGIRGIGPVKAKRILGGVDPDRYWNRIRAAWRGHGAGDPELSRTLLTMLKSWDEFDAITAQISGETPERKQDVLSEQEQDS